MIPLNIRSHYSLMWGTSSITALCRQAKALGYTRIALTDTNNLYGIWSFIAECKDHGLTPIIGAEITDPNTLHRAVCLVKNNQGYSHLTRLITQRHRDKGFSLKKALPRLSKGLIVLTKNPDLLPFWHENNIDLAVNLARTPLSRHHLLCETAQRLNIPMVATPGSFFLSPDDIKIHHMLRAIDNNTCLSRLKPKDMAPDAAFLAPPEAYVKRFDMIPSAIKNSFVLAEKITFKRPDFGIVMPPLNTNQDTNRDKAEPFNIPADQQLLKKTMQGAKKRYGHSLPGPVIQRIEYELAIIRQKNFCEYFLIVQTIVKQASRICGRGSGAASIVAYCLGITNVCPIKHNLYFERFLNPDRTDAPDIDIDFAWDERDDILNWVLNTFKGHAALVSSHILFQPRMAVREVARVFGLPESEISKVSKRLPWFWKRDEASQELLDRIRNRPEFKFMDFPQPWPQIMTYAQAVTGTPRHISVHPGGMVITPNPIDTYVPIEDAPKGVPIIQWEKDGAETAGLIKIDLLGNRSLGVIRDTIQTIQTTSGKFDDFLALDPEDDYETQQNVAQGNTMGCFYIESPAMRLLQKKSKVGDFKHVVIHSSIIRPAANEFIQEYIQRLHTGVWEPIHPILENVLDETLGIMVFQEDVSKVAVKMAGFSHAKADGLRKIISKKDKKKELADYCHQFKKGALANNVLPKDIESVWNMITSFSGYSFCKPHSASYARVSFQAAYLKTHYPAEFMAAVISNQGGFYSTFAYVSEARRLKVNILHPDINKSHIHWKGERLQLRVGFLSIKHLSFKTMTQIIKERNKKPFTDLHDFFNRINPREDEVRSLIHCGCLDGLERRKHRAALLWAFSAWQKQCKTKKKQPSLFDTIPRDQAPFDQTQANLDIPDLPKEDPMNTLRREFLVLGFLCACHPMHLYRDILKSQNIVTATALPQFVGRKVTFAGWLITGKVIRTKHGDPMKFLTFEDETGIVETVFFPKPYALFCHMLDYGRPYLIYGTPDSSWGAITFIVDSVQQVMHKLNAPIQCTKGPFKK
ncbi:MAG: DNA polymerase III subunit alpha [Pseudomonadota bacterium]